MLPIESTKASWLSGVLSMRSAMNEGSMSSGSRSTIECAFNCSIDRVTAPIAPRVPMTPRWGGGRFFGLGMRLRGRVAGRQLIPQQPRKEVLSRHYALPQAD